MDSISQTQKTPTRQLTKLNRQQIIGFWAAWSGWTLDGLASFSYALVLAPALTELLPKSGIRATPGNIGLAGSILFALFLVGWGLAFVWGPLGDRFGRTKTLAGTILVYALFTAAAAFSQNVWQLAIFRLLAGIGIGGEWALAGTYVSEAWPEDRRKMGAGYLQTGYYFGFFIAAALDYTVGAHFGWRAIFLCNLPPVALALVIAAYVHEPERWQKTEAYEHAKHIKPRPMREIFKPAYRRKTIVNAALLTVAIIGLWSGSVYEPTAVIAIAKRMGRTAEASTKLASIATALLSIGTILGCLAVPFLSEWWGRKKTLAFYFAGMGACIFFTFEIAFYWTNGLHAFIAGLFVLGFFGGDFAIFTLWLPEQYDTSVRATAFAFSTSVGRFLGAGANFAVGAMVHGMGTIGTPVAYTAIAFGLGLLLIPFATETRGQALPE